MNLDEEYQWKEIERKEEKYQSLVHKEKKVRKKKQRKRNEKEEKKLMYQTEKIKKKEELKIISQWSRCEFDHVIFDSNICDWRINTSTFDQRVYGKQNIIILLKDDLGNIFGLFLSSLIDSYIIHEKCEWKGRMITDPNAFLFSLKTHNKRLEYPICFPIQKDHQGMAFELYPISCNVLFTVGCYDLCIYKKSLSHWSYCEEKCYDYGGHEFALVGKCGKNNPFHVKRIQVWQMKPYSTPPPNQLIFIDDTMKDEKYCQWKKEQNKLWVVNKIIKGQIDQFNNKEIVHKLRIENVLIDETVSQQFIEKYFKSIKRKHFDTVHCDWKTGTTFFNECIMNHKRLLILITIPNGIKLGCYLSERISDTSSSFLKKKHFSYSSSSLQTKIWKPQTSSYEMNPSIQLIDNKSFLFIYINNELKIFKNRLNSIPSIELFHPNDVRLLKCGNNELFIPKQGMMGYCHRVDEYVFDQGLINFIQPKESLDSKKFSIRRIEVYQLKHQ